jgi:hypothetical protein
MTRILSLSSKLYSATLCLYPSEFAREFGAEMTGIFEEDIADAWQTRGAAGVIRVWYCALSELVCIALPGLATNPFIAVPSVSFLVSVLLLSGELMLARSHPLDPAVKGIVVWQGLAVALISFLPLLAGKSGTPAPLEL